MPEKSIDELESLVGTSVVTVEDFAVEAGKVEEFARAVDDDNPAHRDEAAAHERGFDRIPAPLTFDQVAQFPRYRAVQGRGIDLGFRPEFVVHGEQAYDVERPMQAGDVLTGTATLADIYQRDGRRGGTMTFAEMETEYTDADGETVLTVRSTAIETEGAIQDGDDARDGGGATDGASDDTPTDGGEQRTDGGDRSAGTDERLGRTVPAGGGHPKSPITADEIAVGDTGPEVAVPDLSRTDFVRYAGASGDFNPIHHDETYAEAAGYDSVFGHGMLSAGYAAQTVADTFGLGHVRSLSLRFQSQLWPGDSVTAATEITDVSVHGEMATVEADVDVTTQDGEILTAGSATASIPAER